MLLLVPHVTLQDKMYSLPRVCSYIPDHFTLRVDNDGRKNNIALKEMDENIHRKKWT